MMDRKFFPFPKIGQFRSAVKAVMSKSRFNGLDEQTGEPIYNNDPLPTLQYEGSVKLHGTNASIVRSANDEFSDEDGQLTYTYTPQSRSQKLNFPHSDNAGFAMWCNQKQDAIAELFKPISKILPIAIYGEWCGGNIQKGVGINGLDKMFVIFAAKILSENEEDGDIWIDLDFIKEWITSQNSNGIYYIKQFMSFNITIDFNDPQRKQNDMIEVTETVEAMCPVAKAFGVEGIGEGVVWKCVTKGYESSKFWFKVKGVKHSVSKVKKMASVDVEKLDSISAFVDANVTEARLEQAWDTTGARSRKQTGDFLRWIVNDIYSEEYDTMAANGLSGKDVNAEISKKARVWFFSKLDDEVGL